MPNITPYRLSFHSGYHIGTRGLNLEETGISLPSDTLFAALVDAWQRKNGESNAFTAAFTASPPDPTFLLSSAFPYAGDVLFFPMPCDLARLFASETLELRAKQLKNIRYLSLGLLRKALAGEQLDEYLFPEEEWEEPTRGAGLQGGLCWLDSAEITLLPKAFQRPVGRLHSLVALPIWTGQQLPRVTVGRISASSNLFHAGRVVFSRDCGLWFGIQWLKPDTQVDAYHTSAQALDQALQMLQDDGLGGERSTGYGTFSAQALAPLDLPYEPLGGKLVYLLSRYHPAEHELPAALAPEQGVAYQLTAIAGWLRSLEGPAQRRKRVFFVSEGSLVIQTSSRPPGTVVNVKPTYGNDADLYNRIEHPVYRNGLGLALAWPARR